MKRNTFYGLVIVLLWASLIFFIFEESIEIRDALSNMQLYFKEKYEQLIKRSDGTVNKQEGLSLNSTWFRVCQEGDFNNLPFGLTPNCEIRPVSGIGDLNSYFIKTNSDGFRGREYFVDKPNNTFRIVVLGDSFTFGWGLNLEGTFCYRLEKMLNEKHPAKNFEVLNFGVPGMNTAQEVERFREKALKYKPNLIIIGFTANDDESLEFSALLANYTSFEKIRVANDRLKNNKSLKNIEFVKQPLEELIILSEEFDFKILIYAFDSEDYQYDLFKEFEKVYEAVYFQKASFSEMDREEYHLHRLDPHPSTIANKKYAQEIYETLNKYKLL